ncbi:hypothetical protein B0T25DRAFT_590852 [Lasiosphaeria hispida]|uniref:Translation initiation factor eIF2B subunit alpha n=1 Tax=Lasiosphaeria hispida TaxID=260671 RepID=A0AAJ0HIM7_9PEZI|nr:hypothetical protein B0T25DRAFT_590852 [Lasiosphaeria hispida]
MATDDLSSPTADPGPASTARSADALSTRAIGALNQSNPQTPTHQDGPAPFDIVRTYHDLLASDPEMTMPVAAIESLIDLLRATPSSTAMETVEVVRKEKAKLLESTPNPLPLLAGADLFEQYLLRSLRGQATTGGADERVLSFDETRSHLLHNRQLFAHRARAARDSIAAWGSKYVVHGRVVLAAGGSRTVTRILLRAAADPTRHFKVIYVVDGSERAESSVDALRAAGLEVETISPNKVAYILANQSRINLVLVGTEVVMQNGGIISRMGTCQLAHLTKSVKGSLKRFYVAAETHKIVRKTALAYPMVNRVGIRQKDVSKWENLGREDVEDLGAAAQRLLSEQDEVDYTDPELIDGIITEQGVKMTSQIWEMVDDYI